MVNLLKIFLLLQMTGVASNGQVLVIPHVATDLNTYKNTFIATNPTQLVHTYTVCGFDDAGVLRIIAGIGPAIAG